MVKVSISGPMAPVDRLERFLVVLHHLLGEFWKPLVDNSPTGLLWKQDVRVLDTKVTSIQPQLSSSSFLSTP